MRFDPATSPATSLARPPGRYHRGLSLVELMISMALGLFLSLGMVQIYLANQVTSRLAESSTRMQENGRSALELLAAAVRAGDYWGCLSLTDIRPSPPTADATLAAFINQPGVNIQVNTGAPVFGGSHVLTLIGLEELPSVPPGASVVRANCQTRTLRQTTNLTGTDLNYQTISRRYEIRHTTVAGEGARKTLFLVDGTQTFELVDGIVDVRYQLGGATNPSTWVEANGATAAQLNAASALRISVLVESPMDNMRATQQTLCFPAWATTCNWTATDLRQYAVYTTTVAIRSRANG